MTNQSRSLKVLIALFLLAMTVMGAFAFPSDALGGASRPPSNLQAFTVAGQTRQCSEYADETGSFVGATTILSKNNPALVNVYYVKADGGWTFYNEYSIPEGSNRLQFTGSNRQYAYEIYYCPKTTTVCNAGDYRAVTQKSFQACNNGQWGAETQCSLKTYFDPSTKSCKVFNTCQEQWNCGQWGQCTTDGKQYRTCTDVNSCATAKDMPATAQFCTPAPSTGTTKPQIGKNIELVGQPKLDAYTGATGTVRTVTQRLKVTTAGSYWIEAGLEPLRSFNIASSIEKNTCNPLESWYANQQIPLNPGEQNVTLKVTPAADGEYVLHTAIVTGCAGEVVQQVNAADHLIVGNPDNGASIVSFDSVIGELKGTGALLLIISIGLIIVAVGIYYGTKKRRRR